MYYHYIIFFRFIRLLVNNFEIPLLTRFKIKIITFFFFLMY